MANNPKSTAKIAGYPLHPMFIPFPITFLVATFVCDLIFWRTGNAAWSTASLYLLVPPSSWPPSQLSPA